MLSIRRVATLTSAIAAMFLAGCSSKGVTFEELDGHYKDHIDSEIVSSMAGKQVFMASKKLGFGSPPGRVFRDLGDSKIIKASFIYKDREPHGYTYSRAERDDKREVIDAHRRVLGECQWECIYEEVVWAKVPYNYVEAHTDAGFKMYFFSENGRTERFDISGEQATELSNSVWDASR